MAPKVFPPSRRFFVRGLAVLLALLVVLALGGALLAVRPWAQGQELGTEPDPLVDPTYYASPVAVCSLLTPEDLALALGFTYSAGFEPPATYPAFAGIPGITRCSYVHEDRIEAVTLGIVYAYADQVFEERLEHYGDLGEEAQEVDGLGARAVWAGNFSTLLVVTDDKLIGIQPPQGPDRIERARRLAETVMERLQ